MERRSAQASSGVCASSTIRKTAPEVRTLVTRESSAALLSRRRRRTRAYCFVLDLGRKRRGDKVSLRRARGVSCVRHYCARRFSVAAPSDVHSSSGGGGGQNLRISAPSSRTASRSKHTKISLSSRFLAPAAVYTKMNNSAFVDRVLRSCYSSTLQLRRGKSL